MSWQHLRTVLWLRWRLSRNQMARSRADAVVALILLVLGALLAVGSGVGGVLGGWLGLARAESMVHLVTWDIVVGVFSALWLMHIFVDIQRSESIDIQRLLHLPVSLPQIFLINYVASHLNPILLIFLPGLIGLATGLVLADGLVWLFLFPLILGFLFMVTAWTYCLRGWLVSLMINKRRRQVILVGLTMGFILLCQLPNIYFNVAQRGKHSTQVGPPGAGVQSPSQPSPRRGRENFLVAHQWVPFLWLPYGAKQLADNRPVAALLGTTGFLLIGGLGLQRAYRGTLRFYLATQRQKRVTSKPAALSARKPGRILLERSLPFLPETAGVLTLTFFRSFLRAPEAKMALVAPLIMVILFGSILFRGGESPPGIAQIFMPTALGLFLLMGLIQLFANHFGFDRNGFRALVLSPVPRWHILLAKNIALLVFALALELAVMAVLVWVVRVAWADWLSGLLLFLTGFFCFCMLGNLASILGPWRIAPGSLKPTKMGARAKLMVFAFHLLFPIVLLPVILPVAWQVICAAKGWWPGIPFHVIGSGLALTVVLVLYSLSLEWLGHLLERREKEILQVVTEEVE